MLPCVIFEDDHLLVVNKPPGWNTHAPGPYAGEGIYDWLRHRESRWAALAIVHRLDKETSGVLVFGKTSEANRSLTAQFAGRQVRKKYLLLTDRPAPAQPLTVQSALVRVGEKYLSRPPHAGAGIAETRFQPMPGSALKTQNSKLKILTAEPLTGRTHQIRVHAADRGFPILGDACYGGTAAGRLFLHAAEISFVHPATSKRVTFETPPDFDADPASELRRMSIDPEQTNAFRLIHGAADSWPGWAVDRLGDFLLSQAERPPRDDQRKELERLAGDFAIRGAYHKILSRQIRRTQPDQSSPRLVWGKSAPERFEIRENGVRFELSFQEGYSVGLFLDQRDNRRRLLTRHIAADFDLPLAPGGGLLNVFAYTCGFSVCAAQAGFETTSLDLSRKYLDWGRRNFQLNRLDPTAHEFIYGDAFDWLRRLAKKRRNFDCIILDPPTFSQSREHGAFKVERDWGRLLTAALPLVKPGGILFGSSNAADWPPEKFVSDGERAIQSAGRKIVQRRYFPQPPDFPVSRFEPAYLKTIWWRIE